MGFGWNSRTELLLGTARTERLAQSHVLVVGLGGVGSYTAEMLCRSGVGEMTIVDADEVSETNLNRQLPALHSTVGQAKCDVVALRLKDINPELKLHVVHEFIRDEKTVQLLQAAHYDCVADAIDSVSPKVFLIFHARQLGIPVVSSMGAGAKSDPQQVKVSDISKSYTCPLARIVRKRLHGLGVENGVEAVFSAEASDKEAVIETEGEQCKRTTCGTISYMTAIFGCMQAAAVIKLITQKE